MTITTLLMMSLFMLFSGGPPQDDKQPAKEKSTPNATTGGEASAARLMVNKPVESQAVEAETGETALLDIRRVYVDRLTGGESAAQLRDLIISALQGSKLFVITENEERADAILRGAAEDLVFTDKFTSSDNLSAHTNGSDSSSNNGGSGGFRSSISKSRSMGIGISDNESSHIEERKHEAMATVRLVNKNGDVIWSTTQESLGGKFRGASADVADRIAKTLAADVEHARKLRRLP